MKRVLLAFALSVWTITSIHSANEFGNQEREQVLSLPMLKSIEQELRNPEYAQNILPNNFSYLLQLLKHGMQTHQKRAFSEGMLRLFGNMLKRSQYVNADAFSILLDHAPKLLQPHFVPYKCQAILRFKNLHEMNMFDRFQETVSAMMFTKFSSNYEYFKQDPDKFLDDLTFNIVEIAEEEVSTESLRQTLMRFLEIGINKLIWCPQDQSKTWESVKHLADQLTNLMDFNIINDPEMLNDLFHSLIHRYCFFLDITGPDLCIDVYDRIKNDMATQQLLLLELEEQATFIEPKAEALLRAVMTGEARRRAYEQAHTDQESSYLAQRK